MWAPRENCRSKMWRGKIMLSRSQFEALIQQLPISVERADERQQGPSLQGFFQTPVDRHCQQTRRGKVGELGRLMFELL